MDSSNSSSSSSTDVDEYTRENRRIFYTTAFLAAQLLADEEAASSSQQRRRTSTNRDREGAHQRLLNDYFSDNPIYNEESFKRRFRMSKRLFCRIVDALEAEFPFFQLRYDARGKRGFTPLQKCTAALRQLAYGMASDALDEYLQMAEKTARDCMNSFCKGIIRLFGPQYLRKPTLDDIHKLYAAHESKHQLPGMLGSIDCTHWTWSSCPVAWRGQYMRGDHEHPTLILQAIASTDLWFWHAYFGVAGANNDINVLNASPLVNNIAEGTTPTIPFVVNGAQYRQGYYLADGIYPEWSIFVKSFTCPQDAKRLLFKTVQESARKDIERAFGVLKQRFHIIHNPGRSWSPRHLQRIMYACVILHNMILEDKEAMICALDPHTFVPQLQPPQITEGERAWNVQQIRSRETHNNLRSDLVEHLSQIQPN